MNVGNGLPQKKVFPWWAVLLGVVGVTVIVGAAKRKK